MKVSEDRKFTMARYTAENKAKLRFQEAEYRDRLRLEMVEAYGGVCQHCGEDDPIVLTLDHINDDPGPEYEEAGKSARGGYALYEKLKKKGWPDDRLQLLCFNCNMRKEQKRRRAKMIELYGEPPAPSKALTRAEARAKAGPSINNSVGFKGVVWDHERQKWQARIRVDGVVKVFGRFSDARDAAKAFRKGSVELYGELVKQLTDEEIEEIAKTVKPPEAPVRSLQTSLSIEDLDL